MTKFIQVFFIELTRLMLYLGRLRDKVTNCLHSRERINPSLEFGVKALAFVNRRPVAQHRKSAGCRLFWHFLSSKNEVLEFHHATVFGKHSADEKIPNAAHSYLFAVAYERLNLQAE